MNKIFSSCVLLLVFGRGNTLPTQVYCTHSKVSKLSTKYAKVRFNIFTSTLFSQSAFIDDLVPENEIIGLSKDEYSKSINDFSQDLLTQVNIVKLTLVTCCRLMIQKSYLTIASYFSQLEFFVFQVWTDHQNFVFSPLRQIPEQNIKIDMVIIIIV